MKNRFIFLLLRGNSAAVHRCVSTKENFSSSPRRCVCRRLKLYICEQSDLPTRSSHRPSGCNRLVENNFPSSWLCKTISASPSRVQTLCQWTGYELIPQLLFPQLC